jgi:hypothetical protein
VYVGDTIILGPNEEEMTENIKLLKSKFKLGEEGDLCDYLGIKITRESDGTIVLTQPQLIASIL